MRTTGTETETETEWQCWGDIQKARNNDKSRTDKRWRQEGGEEVETVQVKRIDTRDSRPE